MDKQPNLIGWNLQGIKLEIPKTIKEKVIKHKKHRNSTSSSSSSSSSSDSDQKLRHSNDKDVKRKEKEERRRVKREKRKLKKKLKLEHKLAKKEHKKDKKYKKLGRSRSSDSDDLSVPVDLMNTSARAPETREQYEARQSEIRRLVDPDTGRTRLIKGDGEVLEEIVSRDRHKEINKFATDRDGSYFQSKSIGWMNKNN